MRGSNSNSTLRTQFQFKRKFPFLHFYPLGCRHTTMHHGYTYLPPLQLKWSSIHIYLRFRAYSQIGFWDAITSETRTRNIIKLVGMGVEGLNLSKCKLLYWWNYKTIEAPCSLVSVSRLLQCCCYCSKM